MYKNSLKFLRVLYMIIVKDPSLHVTKKHQMFKKVWKFLIFAHSEKPGLSAIFRSSFVASMVVSMVSLHGSWWLLLLLFPLKALTSTPSPYSWTMPKKPKHQRRRFAPPSDAELLYEVHHPDQVDKVWHEQIKLHFQVLDLHLSKLMMI